MAEAYLTPLDAPQYATLTPVEADVPKTATLIPIDRFEEVPFKGRYPNLYAIGKTVTDMIPYLKYVDPEERERFGKLATNEQTRELLLENLNAVLGLALPAVGKGVAPVISATAERLLPKTFTKLLHKEISIIPNSEALSLAKADTPAVKLEGVPTEKTPTRATLGTSRLPEEVQETVSARMLGGEAGEPLPKTPTMRLQEQKEIVQNIIKNGLVDKDKPIIMDETQRAMYNIADTIRQYPDHATEILQRYNITPDQLADEILAAGSFHGKGLQVFSEWARAMKKAFPQDEYVQELLGKSVDKEIPQTLWGRASDLFRQIDNTRRALMVSQLATAARNVASQAGRSAIGILDDAIQGTLNLARKQKPSEAYADFMGDFTALWDKISPEGRKKVGELLTKYPMEKAQLLGQPVQDIVAGGKISKVAMFFNKMQEDFFRKMAFDARITAGMKKRGLDIAKDEVPQDLMESSIQHSLEMTFSDQARSKMGKDFLKAWNNFQPVMTLVQPFPRFWLNSLKFLWDFNPTGLLSAGYQATIAKNPEAAIQAVSRSMIGGMMLGGAMAIRSNTEIAGERYYEVKAGRGEDGKDRYIDLRAFAPFSTYLYLAEQIMKPENIKPMDRIQALIGINRISGTGLTIVDLMRSRNPETATKIVQEVVGQYLGSFTVPGRTIKDIAGGLGADDETKVAFTRENPVIGPAISNIPGTSGMLPASPKLTEGAVYEREKPILRQLTGITVKSKTELEKEIDRLGIEGIFPRTGDAKLDRLIIEKAGPIVGSVVVDRVLHSDAYSRADDDTKKFMLEKSIGEVRNQSRKSIVVPHIIEMMNKSDDKAEYLKSLVKKNRIGQDELAGVFARGRNALTPEQWRETFKLIFIKK